jgi:hypothetical protein
LIGAGVTKGRARGGGQPLCYPFHNMVLEERVELS